MAFRVLAPDIFRAALGADSFESLSRKLAALGEEVSDSRNAGFFFSALTERQRQRREGRIFIYKEAGYVL